MSDSEPSFPDVSLEWRGALSTSEVARRAREGRLGVVTGCAGSAAVQVALAWLSQLASMPGGARARLLLVVPDDDTLLTAVADAEGLASLASSPGAPPVEILAYLPSEELPWARVQPERRGAFARLASLTALQTSQTATLLVVPARGLLRRTVAPARLERERLRLAAGELLDRDALITHLTRLGYLRVPLVEDPGTFAVRGELLDLWSPSTDLPVRVELEDIAISRLRSFEPSDQRTLSELPEMWVIPARESWLNVEDEAPARAAVLALCDAANTPSSRARALVDELLSGRPFPGVDAYLPAACPLAPLLAHLPSAAPVLLEDPVRCVAELEREATALALAQAQIEPPHFPLSAFALSSSELQSELATRPLLRALRLAQLGASAAPEGEPTDASEFTWLEALDARALETLAAQDMTRLTPSPRQGSKSSANHQKTTLEPLLAAMRGWTEQGLEVRLTARSLTQADRLASLLTHRGWRVSRELTGPAFAPDGSPRLRVLLSSLARGVVLPGDGRVYVTEEEIFGQRAHRRPNRERSPQAFIEDLRQLLPGNYVVHVEHGIGRYVGLERRVVGSSSLEFLVLEYLGGRLYLPVHRLDQVQKFSGGDAEPKLDRLGGLTFAKTKARIQKKVRQLADQLLHLYSERLATRKVPCPERDDAYAAFEASFPFEETRDQANAISDVLGDLEREMVMDRLVCGDVGFGKTEVALRAAFRAAMSGRQVGLLCPTTVLAQQHLATFRNRLSEWGIEVRGLSRFTRPAEVSETLIGLKRGTVDVVIGTHRLLSKDVHFKQLGLLVVDEEQRFGVTHKERIKQLRTSVDVLTLSATPIPRTLQMAVGGLRDLSVISTPPVDRRSIRTITAHLDPALIREAVRRELSRGGQVFYVYNRVAGLEERAARVMELVPEARVAMAHGQMSEVALEKVMVDFIQGDYDVLVCTAIIESGLDIPRANTMLVDRADLFGLSQLYQLRGRVGRSSERAYCYLLVPALSGLTDEARSRLEALERFTELGSGMQVATLDLEMRGAGDFLGGEQSGFVATVGFELFCHMLEDAARELRGEPPQERLEPELSFDVEALLPEEYVSDVGVRLTLYKRLASARDLDDVEQTAWEMEDRFGPPPDEARRFVRLMRLKTRLRSLKVLGCDATARGVTLHLAESTPLDPARIAALAAQTKSGYRLTPDGRLHRRRLDPEPLTDGLELSERMLGELEPCVTGTDHAK